MMARFGESVFELVSLVTQQKKDDQGRKIDWHARAEAYRKRLCSPNTPEGATAISCADKIHNIESLLMGVERLKGREQMMWKELKATPREQLQKFEMLYEDLRKNWQHTVLNDLHLMIDHLKDAIRMPEQLATSKARRLALSVRNSRRTKNDTKNNWGTVTNGSDTE
jgi:(p)ppGpp synthase/HD superfamily hydrolase